MISELLQPGGAQRPPQEQRQRLAEVAFPEPRKGADGRLRRSLLYVPGNMPSMLQNVPVFSADVVIIDLEDAVPASEKDAARHLVRRFLEGYRERTQEVLVRINALDTPWALDDLREILPALPDGIRLPKADTAEIVERLDTTLTEYEEELGLEIGRFKILPSIETALGVANCGEVAEASERLLGIAFGAEGGCRSSRSGSPP